jgi:anti-anti-sigma regulatory factor
VSNQPLRAAQIFHELLDEYRNRGVDLYLTHVNHRVYRTFGKAGIVGLLGADAFRETVADAINIVESTPRTLAR